MKSCGGDIDMLEIRNMKQEDVETVVNMVALDHDKDREKGCSIAKEHTEDHLAIVPQHCYVVVDSDEQILAAMVLHPQEKLFEIEDFHVMDIEQNQEALGMLKSKLLEYLENVETEVLCCPYAIRRFMKI
jgi:hypothetical protein